MKIILVDAVNTLVVDTKLYAPLFDLLEEYKNRKIIVTNANDEQLKEFGLEDLPYEMFTLKHNPDKVDPIYFNKLLEYFNLGKNDVIYFEHNIEAVKSAQSVGILSYHYDYQNKDIEGVKSFLNANL